MDLVDNGGVSINETRVVKDAILKTCYGSRLDEVSAHCRVEVLDTIRKGGRFYCQISIPRPYVVPTQLGDVGAVIPMEWCKMRVFLTSDWSCLCFAWDYNIFRKGSRFSRGEVAVNLATVKGIQVFGTGLRDQSNEDTEANADEEVGLKGIISTNIQYVGCDGRDHIAFIGFESAAEAEMWGEALEGLSLCARTRQGTVGKLRCAMAVPEVESKDQVKLVTVGFESVNAISNVPISGTTTILTALSDVEGERSILFDVPIDERSVRSVVGRVKVKNRNEMDLYFSFDIKAPEPGIKPLSQEFSGECRFLRMAPGTHVVLDPVSDDGVHANQGKMLFWYIPSHENVPRNQGDPIESANIEMETFSKLTYVEQTSYGQAPTVTGMGLSYHDEGPSSATAVHTNTGKGGEQTSFSDGPMVTGMESSYDRKDSTSGLGLQANTEFEAPLDTIPL